jgi:Calcineurin-like phosphoesterase
MKNPIKTFEPNTVGRDFVIGDLHGSYTAFENLLEKLYFDETKDRMFSVGDLCDRGPNSLACLGLLHEPWFHAVLSNHEQMMLEKFRGGYMGEYWFQNGGHWGMEAWNDSKNLSATNAAARGGAAVHHDHQAHERQENPRDPRRAATRIQHHGQGPG